TRFSRDWSSDVCSSDLLVLRTPYNALIIAREKMWFFSATSVIEAVLKLAVAFAITHSSHDRLVLYATLVTSTMWVMFAAFIWFRSEEGRVGKEGRARWW